jgi:hypothetical protein
MNVMSLVDPFRYVLGGSVLALWAFTACGESSKNEPAAHAGSGGAADGGKVGTAGSAGAVGGKASAGGSAGGTAGKSGGGSANAGSAGEAEGGSAGAAPTGPYQAVMGQLCPVKSTIGVVELGGFPSPYVQVALFDGTDPWIGEAELSTPTCAFHHYTAGGCPVCEAEQVCSIAGACVPERRTIKLASLQVTAGTATREYLADAQLGGIYSMLDIGNAAASFGMVLSWGETEVRLAPMPVASAELDEIAVTTEGDSAQPGALDATWKPSAQAAFVRSRIPINHHAGGPTFTECAAPESAGAFHADAEMIDPLAVITGLEFQGVEHVFVAAADTPQGCVEFRFGERISVFPN